MSVWRLAEKEFINLREEEEEEVREIGEEHELDLEELEQAVGIEMGHDDEFEEVDRLILPEVVQRIVNGNTVREIKVPVIEDDSLITSSMFRDDIVPTDSKKSYARILESTEELSQIQYVCSISFSGCDLFKDGEHQASVLPCGHVYGRSCIQTWLQESKDSMKCPQCEVFCLLNDVRPLLKTSIRIPAVDLEIPMRRFPLTKYGFLQFNKFEVGRRNIALVKWSRVRTRLVDVLWRVKALDRLAHESQAWKVKADARRAKAKAKAEALKRMEKGYNLRVNDHLPRLEYFASCCQNL